MQRIVNVAVIGAGNRSYNMVGRLLQESRRRVRIASVYDPDEGCCRRCLGHWESPAAKICSSYQEAIGTPGVDWVMVFSPNARHREHIEAAFAAGKHVFSEKPLASSIEDCQSVYRAHQAHPELLFATGFVMRYTKQYREVKKLLDSGRFGRLLSINADENILPDHGGYIMCNWRRHSREAGPHILEKCCHDLDLINWYCNSLPSKVAAFHKRDFFVPENDGLLKRYGRKTFCSWHDPHAVPDPFTSDKDLMDNLASIATFRNQVIVTFQATMSNAIPERRMYFTCTEGNILAELYSSTIRYRRLGDAAETVYNFRADTHGGGDDPIMKELYHSMRTGEAPKSSGSEGLQSAVYAMAIDRAARENRIVDMEEIWRSLGR